MKRATAEKKFHAQYGREAKEIAELWCNLTEINEPQFALSEKEMSKDGLNSCSLLIFLWEEPKKVAINLCVDRFNV